MRALVDVLLVIFFWSSGFLGQKGERGKVKDKEWGGIAEEEVCWAYYEGLDLETRCGKGRGE